MRGQSNAIFHTQGVAWAEPQCGASPMLYIVHRAQLGRDRGADPMLSRLVWWLGGIMGCPLPDSRVTRRVKCGAGREGVITRELRSSVQL